MSKRTGVTKSRYVGLGQPWPEEEVAVVAEAVFKRVEGGEDVGERLLVGFLRRGEAGPVDAVIEPRVDLGVQRIDLGAKVRRVEVEARVGEVAEAGVQHPQDVRGFVVDDRAALLVPERRHRRAPRDGGIGAGVDLVQVGRAVHHVAIRAGVIGVIAEAPALIGQRRLHH
jgi:hypothetical protein